MAAILDELGHTQIIGLRVLVGQRLVEHSAPVWLGADRADLCFTASDHGRLVPSWFLQTRTTGWTMVQVPGFYRVLEEAQNQNHSDKSSSLLLSVPHPESHVLTQFK